MSTDKVTCFSQSLHDSWWKFSFSDGIKKDVDVFFGKVDFSISLFLIVTGHDDQKLLFFDREGLNEFESGFDKGVFEEGDLVVNILLKAVPEEILSFHSDSFGEPL